MTVAGVDMSISAAPAAGDQFSVTASSPERQNILNTIGDLRKALDTSTAGDPQAQLNIRNMVATALTNLDKASDQVLATQSSIGARLNTIDVLTQETRAWP